jgi:hypothetical protein
MSIQRPEVSRFEKDRQVLERYANTPFKMSEEERQRRAADLADKMASYTMDYSDSYEIMDNDATKESLRDEWLNMTLNADENGMKYAVETMRESMAELNEEYDAANLRAKSFEGTKLEGEQKDAVLQYDRAQNILESIAIHNPNVIKKRLDYEYRTEDMERKMQEFNQSDKQIGSPEFD